MRTILLLRFEYHAFACHIFSVGAFISTADGTLCELWVNHFPLATHHRFYICRRLFVNERNDLPAIIIYDFSVLFVQRSNEHTKCNVNIIPVMLGASLLKVLKFFLEGGSFGGSEAILLLVGCAAAFFVSIVAIRFLTDFVKKHSFSAFGVYRILLGAIVLIVYLVK